MTALPGTPPHSLSSRCLGSLLALAMLASLAACGTTGAETASLALTPIPQGKARVLIKRSGSLVYAGAPAAITLDGQKVADVAVGGSTVLDVAAGDHVIGGSDSGEEASDALLSRLLCAVANDNGAQVELAHVA